MSLEIQCCSIQKWFGNSSWFSLLCWSVAKSSYILCHVPCMSKLHSIPLLPFPSPLCSFRLFPFPSLTRPGSHMKIGESPVFLKLNMREKSDFFHFLCESLAMRDRPFPLILLLPLPSLSSLHLPILLHSIPPTDHRYIDLCTDPPLLLLCPSTSLQALAVSE